MAEAFLDHPSGWEVITLEPKKGSGYIERVESGGTPSTTVDEYWDGDIPWLTPKEITRGNEALYVSATERNITELGVQSSAAKLMPVGTVMLSKRAPCRGSGNINSTHVHKSGFSELCLRRKAPTHLSCLLVGGKQKILRRSGKRIYLSGAVQRRPI